MSTDLVSAGLKNRAGKAKLTYIYLCWKANEDGEAWPSIATISEETEQSKSTVIRHLALLDDLNLITKLKRKGANGSARYSINKEAEFIENSRSVKMTRVKMKPSKCQNEPVEVSKCASRSVKMRHNKQDKQLKTIINKENVFKLTDNLPAKKTKKSEIPARHELPDGLNLDSWFEWVEQRSSMKKKLLKRSWLAQARKLSQYTHDEQFTVIDLSIQNGWQGLFFDKLDGAHNYAKNQSARDRRDEIDRLRTDAVRGATADNW